MSGHPIRTACRMSGWVSNGPRTVFHAARGKACRKAPGNARGGPAERGARALCTSAGQLLGRAGLLSASEYVRGGAGVRDTGLPAVHRSRCFIAGEDRINTPATLPAELYVTWSFRIRQILAFPVRESEASVCDCDEFAGLGIRITVIQVLAGAHGFASGILASAALTILDDTSDFLLLSIIERGQIILAFSSSMRAAQSWWINGVIWSPGINVLILSPAAADSRQPCSRDRARFCMTCSPMNCA